MSIGLRKYCCWGNLPNAPNARTGSCTFYMCPWGPSLRTAGRHQEDWLQCFFEHSLSLALVIHSDIWIYLPTCSATYLSLAFNSSNPQVPFFYISVSHLIRSRYVSPCVYVFPRFTFNVQPPNDLCKVLLLFSPLNTTQLSVYPHLESRKAIYFYSNADTM